MKDYPWTQADETPELDQAANEAGAAAEEEKVALAAEAKRLGGVVIGDRIFIEHGYEEGRHEFGRIPVWITCPFCEREVQTYLWSLYGSGKLCPECGAHHTSHGSWSPRKKVKHG